MSAQIGNGITLAGIIDTGGNVTLYLDSSVTRADIGKPMSLVSGQNNTVIVAPNGARIFGRLDTFEDRVQEGIKVGMIQTEGGFLFSVLAADALLTNGQGSSAIGAGSGKIKAGTDAGNFVTELDGSGNAVVYIR